MNRMLCAAGFPCSLLPRCLKNQLAPARSAGALPHGRWRDHCYCCTAAVPGVAGGGGGGVVDAAGDAAASR